MTTLKDINFGLNQYCGPAVLSALTGKSTDECASVISSISGQTVIKAVQVDHLLKALNKLRFDTVSVNSTHRTLFGTLSNLSSRDGLYIILVPKHVVAVEITNSKIYLVDNHSKSPLPANSSARLMQSVTSIYQIIPKGLPKYVKTEIKVDKRIYENRILIEATDVYEDYNDNVYMNCGQFYFRNDDELRVIVENLKEIVR